MKNERPLVTDYVMAGFPLLAVNTFEPDRLESQIEKEVEGLQEHMKKLEGDEYVPMTVYGWDCVQGLRNITARRKPDPKYITVPSILQFFQEECGEKAILLLYNFHRFLGTDTKTIQKLINMVPLLKISLRTIIMVTPGITLPPELERIVTVIDHPLPGIEDIRKEFEKISGEWKLKVDKKKLEHSIEVSTGLTLFEAENAISLSAVREKAIEPDVIFDIKSQLVKRHGDLEVGTFKESLSDLQGMEELKRFGLDVLGHPLARGVLILGVQGCGKSHLAKAMGKEIGLQTISLAFGNMFASLVGASERKIKNATHIIDAMAPCVLFIDELEKDLAGVQASGEHDSGVTKRVMKTFLVWMNDHESRVPIIATANGLRGVPPEFLRAERWDAIFFVDLPTAVEAQAILCHYIDYYNKLNPRLELALDAFKEKGIDIENYTGAEIKTLCRLSSIFNGDIVRAYGNVVPIYKAKKAEIERLRDDAMKFAIPANGIKTELRKEVKGKGVRKVITAPQTTN